MTDIVITTNGKFSCHFVYPRILSNKEIDAILKEETAIHPAGVKIEMTVKTK